MTATLWVNTIKDETVELGGSLQLYNALAQWRKAHGPRFFDDYPDLGAVCSWVESQEDVPQEVLADISRQATSFLGRYGNQLDGQSVGVLTVLSQIPKPWHPVANENVIRIRNNEAQLYDRLSGQWVPITQNELAVLYLNTSPPEDQLAAEDRKREVERAKRYSERLDQARKLLAKRKQERMDRQAKEAVENAIEEDEEDEYDSLFLDAMEVLGYPDDSWLTHNIELTTNANSGGHWVTLDNDQRVFIGGDGALRPGGPGSAAVASKGGGGGAAQTPTQTATTTSAARLIPLDKMDSKSMAKEATHLIQKLSKSNMGTDEDRQRLADIMTHFGSSMYGGKGSKEAQTQAPVARLATDQKSQYDAARVVFSPNKSATSQTPAQPAGPEKNPPITVVSKERFALDQKTRDEMNATFRQRKELMHKDREGTATDDEKAKIEKMTKRLVEIRDEARRILSGGKAEDKTVQQKERQKQQQQEQQKRQDQGKIDEQQKNIDKTKEIQEKFKQERLQQEKQDEQKRILEEQQRIDRDRQLKRRKDLEEAKAMLEKMKSERLGVDKAVSGVKEGQGLSRQSLNDLGKGQASPELHIAKALSNAATAHADTRAHGMVNPESGMKSVKIDKTSWVWNKDVDTTARDSMAKIVAADVPSALLKSNKQVIYSTQKNKDDSFWEKKYRDKGFVSAATGGDGNIVVYNGKGMSVNTFLHESGHNLAFKAWGTTTPPKESSYAKAQAAEKPVSDYGRNSRAEDFAEACMLYGHNKTRAKFEQDFPMKAAALREILDKYQ